MSPPSDNRCELPGGGAGGCLDGVCLPIGCGNGVVEAGEACDDGNTLGGDGCSARCDSDETCGNGFLDTAKSEGCDCGDENFPGERPPACDGRPNSDAADAVCTSACQIRGCGDGVVGGLEDCDGEDLPLTSCSAVGFYEGTLSCLDSCRYDTSGCSGRCGDDTRNGLAGGPIEKCDGPDLAGLDCTDFGYYYADNLACNVVCGFDTSGCAGRCGDDIYDDGFEICDTGEDETELAARGLDCTDFGYYASPGLACSASCQIDTDGCTEWCGDDVINGTEQCESNVPLDKDCTDFGFYQPDGLTCDAGCHYDTSGCNETCGDDTVNGPEQCDGSVPGNLDCTDFGYYLPDGLACSGGCTFDVGGCSEFCGDNSVNGPEDCEPSLGVGAHDCTEFGYYLPGGLACGAGCRWNTDNCNERCGDNAINGTEHCESSLPLGKDCTDFGYYQPEGLTCSNACTYDVAGCSTICGDDVVDAPEDCEPALGVGATDCTDFGFYQPDGLACSDACGFDTGACLEWCGDDLVNGPELCDGAPPSGLACTTAGWDAGQLGCAVGCYDTFDHCRRIGFSEEYTGLAGSTITGIWGIGREFFALTSYAVLHSNGGAWTRSNQIFTGNGIWGAAADDVFVVTNITSGNVVFHYDGTSWSPMTVPAPAVVNLKAVSGTADNDVWAVGLSGTVIHYNGVSWSKVTTPISSSVTLNAVWASTPNDVFVAGSGNTMYYWNGSIWEDQSFGTNYFESLWGLSSTNVYATAQTAGGSRVVYHYDGSWTPMTACANGLQPRAVGGMPGGPVIAVGDTIAQPDVAAICQLAEGKWFPVTVPGSGLLRAVGGSAEYLRTGGDWGTMLSSPGAAWLEVESPPNIVSIEAMWAASVSELYVVGDDPVTGGKIYRYTDAGGWIKATLPDYGSTLYDVWGGAGWRVAVGGYGRVASSSSGTSWTDQTSNTANNLNAVWGNSTDVFAVGDSGTIVRRAVSGSTWTVQVPSPVVTQHLNAVWGSGTTVFAVGNSGTILRKVGAGSWTTMTSGTAYNLRAVWGLSATDVYAGGDGEFLHFDGSTWSAVPARGAVDLWGQAGDLFISWGNPDLAQLVGGRWLPVRLPAPSVYGGKDMFGFDEITWFVGSQSTENALYALGGRIFRPTVGESNCEDFWDDDGDGLLDCADPDCAASSACTNGGGCQPLVALTCGDTVAGTTVTGQNRWPAYPLTGTRWMTGTEAYYRISRATAGTIQLTLSGYSGTLRLFVPETSATGACLPDKSCLAGGSSVVNLSAEADTEYIVIVDGEDGAMSSFTLQASCP